ncbi:MAG: DUF4435 domain-containing protein [Prevotellaceae bacterium]|nr:DUF4435 domain-containing protein [Prevotellaceae bacterium]
MPGLGQYLNSDYIAASNALNGKKSRRKIVAFVESYDDVFFWRSILSQLETPERYFQVMLPARGRKLERGKKAVLMSAFKDSVGPDMIACVDADYDYLKQGSNEMSRQVCQNPYVFHTYAYAIENLQCWAPALREVCVMSTLVDSTDILDFEDFLARFSETIYPLFVWNILCSRNATYGDFGIVDFIKTIQTGIVVRRFVDDTIKRVGEKVQRKLHQIEAVASTKAKEAYKELLEELPRLGVLPQETYLYIQGHSLFSDMIVPMLRKVCERLIEEREQEIRFQSKHQTQEENEITCYEHSLEGISSMLKKNTLYLRSSQVQRIIKDINSSLK